METKVLTNEEYKSAGAELERLSAPLISLLKELEFSFGDTSAVKNSPRGIIFQLVQDLENVPKKVGDGFGIVSNRIRIEEYHRQQEEERQRLEREAAEREAYENSPEGKLERLERLERLMGLQNKEKPAEKRVIDLSPKIQEGSVHSSKTEKEEKPVVHNVVDLSYKKDSLMPTFY